MTKEGVIKRDFSHPFFLSVLKQGDQIGKVVKIFDKLKK